MNGKERESVSRLGDVSPVTNLKMEKRRAGRKVRGNGLLIAGLLLIAFNLRPALATVGPLIGDIRESTGLSNGMLGLLTTLPLLAFGIVSSLTSLVTRRIGIGFTLILAMCLLGVGAGLRYFNSVFLLYVGTVLLGIGIAFGNVLLPSVTKQTFEARSGFITALYSGVMAIGASVAAGLSVPLAYDLGFGWPGTLAIWAVPAVVSILVWWPNRRGFPRIDQKDSYLRSIITLAKKGLAWKIALFMGLQSLIFYTMLAWLPEILQSRGADAHFAGWMLALSQAAGILGSLIVPIWAGKSNQKQIVLLLGAVELLGLIGLLFPAQSLVPLWVSLIGFVLGGTFGLALLFIVLRAKDTETTTELSGMAQSIGYLVAATGPILFGNLFDLTGGWIYPLILLLFVTVIKFYCGYGAAGEGKI